MSVRKKYTYNDVKEMVEKEGYELISTEEKIVNDKGFVYVKTYIQIKCPNEKHEKYSTSLGNFIRGSRCKKCLADTLRNSYDYVKEYIESFGYELLSYEYKTTHDYLNIRCPKGHEFKIKYGNFYQGQRCSICANEKRSESQKHDYVYVKNYIESFNYKLLSDKYENARQKLLVQCDKGHTPYRVRFDNFKTGYRCPICGNIEVGNKNRFSFEYIKEFIEYENYKLLSEKYDGTHKKISLKCPNGHIWNTTFDGFKIGHRCPYCKESKGERVIMNYLDKNNIKYDYNVGYFNNLNGKSSKPLRPDFILLDHKIWIEYDGEQHYQYGYFGSDLLELMNIKYRDKLKDDYAKENGWNLIRIPYWEFNNIETILNKIIK